MKKKKKKLGKYIKACLIICARKSLEKCKRKNFNGAAATPPSIISKKKTHPRETNIFSK